MRLQGRREGVGTRFVGFGAEVQVIVLLRVQYRIQAGDRRHADGAGSFFNSLLQEKPPNLSLFLSFFLKKNEDFG